MDRLLSGRAFQPPIGADVEDSCSRLDQIGSPSMSAISTLTVEPTLAHGQGRLIDSGMPPFPIGVR